MSLSFEILLIVGATAFYIYDSTELLRIDEFVLMRSGNRWSFACPRYDWQIRNQWVFVPNPFRPDMEIFLASWKSREGRIDSVRRVDRLSDDMRWVRYGVRILFALLFVATPFVALTFGSGFQLLTVFALIYSVAIVLAYRLSVERQHLRLSIGRLVVLVAEGILCPPFGVNMVRKVSFRSMNLGDPLLFAERVLDPVSFGRLIESISARVDLQLCWLEDDSVDRPALQEYRNRLEGLLV